MLSTENRKWKRNTHTENESRWAESGIWYENEANIQVLMCFLVCTRFLTDFRRCSFVCLLSTARLVPRTWYYYIHDGIFIHIKLINIKLEQALKSCTTHNSLARSHSLFIAQYFYALCNFIFKLRILFSHINTFMQMVCAWAGALNAVSLDYYNG